MLLHYIVGPPPSKRMKLNGEICTLSFSCCMITMVKVNYISGTSNITCLGDVYMINRSVPIYQYVSVALALIRVVDTNPLRVG